MVEHIVVIIIIRSLFPEVRTKQLSYLFPSSYVEGYGREFGGKTTYSVGVVYGLGLLSGGLYGFGVGARKGGSTPKLFFNSVMNGMSAKGRDAAAP